MCHDRALLLELGDLLYNGLTCHPFHGRNPQPGQSQVSLSGNCPNMSDFCPQRLLIDMQQHRQLPKMSLVFTCGTWANFALVTRHQSVGASQKRGAGTLAMFSLGNALL